MNKQISFLNYKNLELLSPRDLVSFFEYLSSTKGFKVKTKVVVTSIEVDVNPANSLMSTVYIMFNYNEEKLLFVNYRDNNFCVQNMKIE